MTIDLFLGYTGSLRVSFVISLSSLSSLNE